MIRLTHKLLFLASAGIFALPAYTQSTYVPGAAEFRDGTDAVAALHASSRASAAAEILTAPLTAPTGLSTPTGLPTWTYNVTSPANGLSYSGTMVGASPYARPARTTTIPTVIVPVVLTLHNTTTGFTATFDPSSEPDHGCTAGRTAINLVLESPIFHDRNWTMNGVYVGYTQYIDAFQRANFWLPTRNDGHEYHTKLTKKVGDPLVITVNYATPSFAADVLTNLSGPCTNPSGSTNVNVAGFQALVDINTIDNAARNYISAHGITPNQLPIFILYNSVMPAGAGFYFAGYHSLTSSSGGASYQTYAVSDFQTNSFFAGALIDTSILAHELAEWLDDPYVTNPTPAWGGIGQVGGCQGNLEVGDPLTGTNLPTITGPNGFQYHLQELAFFSWFFRTPALGPGGLFSNNGSFTTDAGLTCLP